MFLQPGKSQMPATSRIKQKAEKKKLKILEITGPKALFGWAFGPKSQKPNQRGCFWRVFFQKQLLFRSSFLKAGLTLLLVFGFLLFEIGRIKSSSIVVSREIKIKGIFYTCLTKQLSAFLQLTAHSSFSTAHSPQQLFPTATAQPNRA